MPKGVYLGDFEHLVLLAVVRLEGDAYGISVRDEITNRTDRGASLGAVYATLDRLEAKGYVLSRLGDATAERGGRAKRLFTITAEGKEALRESERALLSMRRGLSLA